MVLMAIQGIGCDSERAYGAAIAERISNETGEDTPLQTIYDCLKKLKDRKYIQNEARRALV